MRVFLRIESNEDSEENWVFQDGRKSHALEKGRVEALMDEADQGLWHDNQEAGQRFGQKLYRLLDGGNGLLGDLRQKCSDKGESLALYLQLPDAWRHLPFEILWDGNSFFTLSEDHHLIRQVTKKNRFKEAKLEKRPMSLLFMACSPENERRVLNFEAEEEVITRTIEEEKLPLEITVEDSGSLDGLKMTLKGLGPFDMLHLSGHANLNENGPVFFMESETGTTAKVTPNRLWSSLANRGLKLLFLSGFETGKTKGLATSSFAHSIVAKGIPMVIGWGLPTTDVGAMRFVTALYKLLGEGLPLDLAVNQARQRTCKDYRTWSLLRIFCDGTPLGPMADPPQKVVPRPRRQQTYQLLEQSQVKVLEYGFVGRRRQVQLGLRVLRGYLPRKNGLLITGTAGVGKSTLAGKLIERTPKKERIIFSGRIEEGEVLTKLLQFFERIGTRQAFQFLETDRPYEERIKTLFREVFHKVPTLIIFDDFEQNLVHEESCHRLADGPRMAFQPFIKGISWAQGQTQLIITCRYPFTLMRDGRDLVENQLQHVPLLGLEGADLSKKCRLLENIEVSPHKQAFEKASGGNPRLLEWFEMLAKNATDLDPKDLAKLLAEKGEAFVQEYLADMLASAQEESFKRFLVKASVYRTSVPAAAYAAFGDQSHLEKALALTLMEREDRNGVPHYWVLPMVRDRFLTKLEDSKRVHAEAYGWYDAQTIDEQWHIDERSACLHHGALAFGMMGCWQHAHVMTYYYEQMRLHHEGVNLLKPLVEYIDEKALIRDLKEENGDAVGFLNNLAGLLTSHGDLSEAKSYYEQVLAIRLKVLGKKHSDTAQSLINLGSLLRSSRELEEAKTNYEQALEIFVELLGEQHPNTMAAMENLDVLTSEIEKTLSRGSKTISDSRHGRITKTTVKESPKLTGAPTQKDLFPRSVLTEEDHGNGLTRTLIKIDSEKREANQELQAHKLELIGESVEGFCQESDFSFPWQTKETEGVDKTVKVELSKASVYERMVDVFFASNRSVTQSSHPEKRFGTVRSDLHHGNCLVSIPPGHKLGTLERPSFIPLQFRPDPNRHMMLLGLNIQTSNDFFESVREKMVETQTQTAFVFVHGYNVTFTQAALRTAQIAYDLAFKGVPILYSWPSKGRILGYGHDEVNIKWATPLLKEFLKDILAKTDAKKVILIGDSLGSRGLTNAVVDLVSENPQSALRLGEIILTTPDIPAFVFERGFLPILKRKNLSVTMYSSGTDVALRSAKSFNNYPRAGQIDDYLIIAPGIETIDTTNFAPGFLQHSYFSYSGGIFNDMGWLMRYGLRADDRPTLLPRDTPKGRYWVLKP